VTAIVIKKGTKIVAINSAAGQLWEGTSKTVEAV
jgi:hypothetical protein